MSEIPSQVPSHLQIVLASISAFSNDGKLDASELGAMIATAQKDGEITADEARVLVDIIGKITDAELTPAMQAAIANLRAKLPTLA